MDDKRAQYEILASNLVERISTDQASGQKSLPGLITEGELDALKYCLSLLRAVSDEVDVPAGSPPLSLRSKEAELPSLVSAAALPCPAVPGAAVPQPEAEVEKEPGAGQITSQGIEKLLIIRAPGEAGFEESLRLGLDFGTAYSKACMIRTEDNEEEILDMPLGMFAGEDALIMPVHSTLFIDSNGRLYFGPIAKERSIRARESGSASARIDSIKSFLIDDTRVTIDDRPLSGQFNPSGIPVPKAALVTFYLGYLLHLVNKIASEKYRIDISQVRRRISIPCYASGHREKVMDELGKLFTYGEIISRSFDREWEHGFRVEDVAYLYKWMAENVHHSSSYIESYMTEPLAVASSRLSREATLNGSVCMIVDIGAGTTDFAMYEIHASARSGYSSAREIKGSQYGVPVAGDALDTLLLKYILARSGVNRSRPDYLETLVSLRLDIRDYKERLFEKKMLGYTLGGYTGEIVLSEFMEDPGVKNFSLKLRDAFVHVLSCVSPTYLRTRLPRLRDYPRLPVILTGGGADLPMIRALAKGVLEVGGQSIELALAPRVPTWIEDNYEGEIIALYSQLAVSIGSAKQFVLDHVAQE